MLLINTLTLTVTMSYEGLYYNRSYVPLTIEGSAKTESIKQGCYGYGDPHGYGMGMIFHPHRPMGFHGDF